jgi:hypothetical protein
MDEESIQRLIYIVIIVIVLVVNFSIRNKKKKIQAEQKKQISKEAHQEIPVTLSDIRTTESNRNEVDELKTITSNNLQMSDSYIKKVSRMESNNQSRMTKLQTKHIATIDIEEESFKLSQDELKKAIIYSEIITKREY